MRLNGKVAVITGGTKGIGRVTAIMMAQQEIDNGQFPAAVDMAQIIKSSQQKEIDSMQAMLDK